MIDPLSTLIGLIAPIIVGVIGWLIRKQFGEFDRKLDRLVERVEQHGNQITALETTVLGYQRGGFKRREDDY
jgi:hypothetical protein